MNVEQDVVYAINVIEGNVGFLSKVRDLRRGHRGRGETKRLEGGDGGGG